MDSSWIASQKKAFARWANNILKQRSLVINDIDHDLRTGTLLISLIEILEGENTTKRNLQSSTTNLHAESKIQNFTNATKALKFIETQGINLVNCRAEHLVDNNSKMVLGLLWRVITHYHIQPLFAEEEETKDKDKEPDFDGGKAAIDGNKSLRLKGLLNKSQRDALLRWCKTQLEPYNITPSNFTKNFQPIVISGLVHSLKPDSISMEEIEKMEPAAAFAKVFEVAESQLEIPKILDPSDLVDGVADECSVMTYIAYFVKKANPSASPLPRPSAIKSRSQTDLPSLGQRTVSVNLNETRVDEASEELANENSKLRSENRMLKEFIKRELEKIGTTMEQNMQHTAQQVEAKQSLFVTRTLSFKDSLGRLTTRYAELMRETDKLKAENQNLQQTNQGLNQTNQGLHNEKQSLQQENQTLQQTNQGLQQEKVGLQQEKMGLQQEKVGLQQENQTLQQQLNQRSAPSSPTIIPSSPKLATADDGATKLMDPVHIEDDDTSEGSQVTPVGSPRIQQSTSSPIVASSESVSPILPKSPSTTQPEPLTLETPGNPTSVQTLSKRKQQKQGLTGEALKVYNITIVQSLVRKWITKRWVKRSNRRKIVVSELITTERTHVGCLQTLLSEYFQPLRKMASEGQPLSHILNENLLKTIFNNAEVICNINSNLLAKLEQRWQAWNYSSKIGDVFLSTMEFLKCYNQYVNHYNRSVSTLAECAKIPAFMDFLKVKALKCGHQLRDLLIVPVQRIPRYVLVLEELVKYTDNKHPDFKDLSLALSKMHAIADYVNEKKRDFEALAQVSLIQENLIGISILEYPRLRFLQEGDLTSEEKKQTKQYHVFLFNEILLCTKQVKKVFGDRKQKQVKYKFLEMIKLTPDTKVVKSECSFSVEVPNTPSKKFNTTTDKERDLWSNNITSSVDKMIAAKQTRA